jgi:hypothetical protein
MKSEAKFEIEEDRCRSSLNGMKAELTSSLSMVGEYRGITGISEFTTLLIMVLVKSELHNCADMKIKEIGL